MSNQEQTTGDQAELEQLKSKIERLKEQLEQCEKEREEYLSGWKRSRANLLNYKKKERERLDQAEQKAEKQFILKLLPVLDSFDRAEKSGSGLEKGVEQIRKELQSILAQEGVNRINTDQQFDPNLHEATEQVPSEQQQGTILEEVTAGYKFRGEVIRAAEVKVAAEENINGNQSNG